MAKLAPVDEDDEGRLTDVHGWLDADHPFFDLVDTAVERRARHRPRVRSGLARKRRRT